MSNELLNKYVDYIKSDNQLKRTPTGFNKLDNLLNGGFSNGLTCLGAISSLGKTTFALQLADNMAKLENTKVLFFSLEMTNFDLISKSLSRLSFLNEEFDNYTYDDFMYGNNYDNVAPILKEYEELIENISYIDNVYDIRGISDNIKQFREENPNDNIIVFIDYLQYVVCGNSLNDKQAIDISVKTLKHLAKQLDITIIAISSLNRANYGNEIEMESFKESGNIEYTCDLLMGLELANLNYDKKEELKKIPRKVNLSIIKNRYGKLGKIKYDFYTTYNTFVEK